MWGECLHEQGRGGQVCGDLTLDLARGDAGRVKVAEALLDAGIDEHGVQGGEVLEDASCMRLERSEVGDVELDPWLAPIFMWSLHGTHTWRVSSPFSSFASVVRLASFRPVAMTFFPRAWNRRTSCSPIPVVPPMMRMVLIRDVMMDLGLVSTRTTFQRCMIAIDGEVEKLDVRNQQR